MTIQAVKRALDILSLFSPSRPSMGLAEISRLVGLPKPTVHGLVQTLLQEGYLSQDDQTRQYAVGLKVVELGSLFAGSLKINQVAGDLAQRMAVASGQHVRLAIWDNDTLLVTHNAFPSLDHLTYQQVGPRIPAYCSAVGKAVLSVLGDRELAVYLDRTPLQGFTVNTITDRRKLEKCLRKAAGEGYATENQEFLLGISCVAVPIYGSSARVMGGISLSGAPDILERERLAELVPLLVRTGMEISRRMGYRPGPGGSTREE